MKSNYKVAYDNEWRRLKTRDFEKIAEIRNVNYNKEKQEFTIKVFNKDYILNCNDETIKRSIDNYVPSVETGIMILNYLSFTEEDINISNKWISLKEIPNGGMMFYPAFYKSNIVKLIDNFGYDCEKLKECATKLGGREIKMGDKAFVFDVFPKVPIGVTVWEGDDEIKPSAIVLFDSSVQFMMHVESIIGLGGYIVSKIINQLEQ